MDLELPPICRNGRLLQLSGAVEFVCHPPPKTACWSDSAMLCTALAEGGVLPGDCQHQAWIPRKGACRETKNAPPWRFPRW